MLDLLLATLEMMGLTFVIGFFVAVVIKLIATAADSFDFYSSHQEELQRLRRMKKIRQRMELLIKRLPVDDEDYPDDGREDFSRGINKEFKGYHGYYHGVSPGESEMNLVDYYYPEDTHIVFLQKQEEMLNRNNKNKKESSANTKK